MTNTEKNILQYLLAADGVNQLERAQAALDPGKLKIDDRSMGDLLRFLYALSHHIRFYNQDLQLQGNWAPFFELLHHGSPVLPDTLTDAAISNLLQTRDDLPPHLALLLAFLHIFSYVQQDMNALTSRRLKYYYEDVLQIARKAARPDQVHVLFEPAKNAKPVLLNAGTLLDAGKTGTGALLQYALDSELVITQTTISEVRSSYTDVNTNGNAIVFKAADARTVLNSTATAWKPFGSSQLLSSPETRSMEAACFGWAIASPVLLLAEGTRVITLSIDLKNMEGATVVIDDLEEPLDITGALQVGLSAEKEWLQPDNILKAQLVQLDALNDIFQLRMTVSLSNTAPPVTAYSETVHQAHLATPWPVIRVQLLPESYLLETLSQFSTESISIEVAVSGVKNLVLQNDQSIQPVDKPILPFGSFPAIGSGFYIGSAEIFSKTLTSLSVQLHWEDPPDNLVDYYRTYYDSLNVENGSFKVNMELLSGKTWDTGLHAGIAIFDTSDATKARSLEVNKSDFANLTANRPFKRSPGLQLPGEFNNTLHQGFLRLVLTGPANVPLPDEGPFEAFGHKVYPGVYTQKVIALSKHENGPKPVLPKPPYTPVLKTISLDYTAREVFSPGTPNGTDQYFILDVFGAAETGKNDKAVLVQPQPGKGVLYIGLQQADVPQTVSMLFQVEEGNAVGSELLGTQDLHWSYLAGNNWVPVQAADIIEDSTSGLQQPGLIRLNIGADASLQHSLMPAGARWLRVSVNDNQDGAGGIQHIATQAARATLVLLPETSALYEQHLSAPLPAGAIGKLVQKVPAIKKVLQPYPSFGGRNQEVDSAYYRRVSERLRHKNRATTAGDYEHLFLEYFPDIYKVKCLSHSGTEGLLMPGQVQVVVVPDWRRRKAGSPLQPMVNQYQLREMATTISQQCCDPFVQLQVANPVYETLLVHCKVNFHAAFDPGYYAAVLETEVKKFLSPWAYEEGQDIVFGGQVYASEIQAFIESREYVDNVVGFELYHQHQGGLTGDGINNMVIGHDFIVGYSPEATIATLLDAVTGAQTGGKAINADFIVGEPVETAAATRPDSILVSNLYHRIEALQAEDTFCQGTQVIGIGKMIIGLDFVTIS
ncbi:baseplate J/gp47 family protein [Chitinophaga japonensis]|uniref:Baseplate J-like protein n=1 Tax=Chitinophaga japonensis TaxID=104662 RepID=A0A562T169_CHIJA|nr:baseplate J/gp47 family protein [Chitinophaga japonensis]TWI87023.1 baseplate J-like protein [Chitinophaga japonensis]